MKTLMILAVLGLSINVISACGWFIYSDYSSDKIPTRVYYDVFDNIQGVEDSTLMMSRLPTPLEIEKNVFIPMISQAKFQGPVPEGYDEEYFRMTGITRSK